MEKQREDEMKSLLLGTAARWISPVLIAMSVFFWLRGHNEPGGGFVAGLICSAGIVVRLISWNSDPRRFAIFGLRPLQLCGIGLLLSLASGLLSLFREQPYMTGVWHFQSWLPVVGFSKFGTPFYFDTGVFIVVVGVVLQVFLAIEESDWKSS